MKWQYITDYIMCGCQKEAVEAGFLVCNANPIIPVFQITGGGEGLPTTLD